MIRKVYGISHLNILYTNRRYDDIYILAFSKILHRMLNLFASDYSILPSTRINRAAAKANLNLNFRSTKHGDVD